MLDYEYDVSITACVHPSQRCSSTHPPQRQGCRSGASGPARGLGIAPGAYQAPRTLPPKVVGGAGAPSWHEATNKTYIPDEWEEWSGTSFFV